MHIFVKFFDVVSWTAFSPWLNKSHAIFEGNLTTVAHMTSDSDNEVGDFSEGQHCACGSKISSKLAAWASSNYIPLQLCRSIAYHATITTSFAQRYQNTDTDGHFDFVLKSVANGSYIHFRLVLSLQNTFYELIFVSLRTSRMLRFTYILMDLHCSRARWPSYGLFWAGLFIPCQLHPLS